MVLSFDFFLRNKFLSALKLLMLSLCKKENFLKTIDQKSIHSKKSFFSNFHRPFLDHQPWD